MKNKIILLSSILVAFLVGCLTTFIVMTKRQMDEVMQAKQQSSSMAQPSVHTSDASSSSTTIDNKAPTSSDNVALPSIENINASGEASINDYSEAQAKQIIDKMPDYVLGQYVDKFMTKDASNVIIDKRRFAERAIEELYQPNDNQRLVGEVRLSLDPTMPAASVDTSTINKDAKIYAHLDTKGQVPASPFVFVKWVNNQTGQVLLFEKKDIVADSNQNWVSFKPYDGWQPSSYDIRFYQFTSELQPVAQLTYNIYNVTE